MFFTSELNVQVSELFTLGNDLRRALDREEFVLHYQPQIDLTPGNWIGAEALIRWQHPKRGLIPLDHLHSDRRGNRIDQCNRRMDPADRLRAKPPLADRRRLRPCRSPSTRPPNNGCNRI